MNHDKQEILKEINNFLSPIKDKSSVFIIGSFVDNDEYDDIDFIVITSESKKEIFYIFYTLSIYLNKKIDLVVMNKIEYNKFINDGESINTHQVFLPPKKRKCLFVNNMLDLENV